MTEKMGQTAAWFVEGLSIEENKQKMLNRVSRKCLLLV